MTVAMRFHRSPKLAWRGLPGGRLRRRHRSLLLGSAYVGGPREDMFIPSN